jgi:hypothetical protein
MTCEDNRKLRTARPYHLPSPAMSSEISAFLFGWTLGTGA